MLLAGLLHEFAILAVVAHGVTLLVSGVPRPVTRAWTVAAWGAAAGPLPLAVFSAGQSGQVAWIAWPDPVQLLGLLAMAVVSVWCARSPVTGRGPISLASLALPIVILPGLFLLLLAPVPLFVDRLGLARQGDPASRSGRRAANHPLTSRRRRRDADPARHPPRAGSGRDVADVPGGPGPPQPRARAAWPAGFALPSTVGSRRARASG